MRRALPVLLLGLAACGDPRDPATDEGVGYRNPLDTGGLVSGERGTLKIAEVDWAGSVNDDGTYDPADVYIEIRNEGSSPVTLAGWRIVEKGSITRTFRFPEDAAAKALKLYTGDHVFAAAKTTGCFPTPDYVIPDLAFPDGDPFSLTLEDYDERLVDQAGSTDLPAFAGGWDGVVVRSMEKVELMFGSDGGFPESWHFNVSGAGDPTSTRISTTCGKHTFGSPGIANSQDYSGAYASGSPD